jgi:HEPN domain-containing protein
MTKRLCDLWLERAEEDLRSARVLLDARLYNMVCFHSQQTVEKSLKGLLVSLGHPTPRIHNLIRLRKLCEDALRISLGIDEKRL